ncbi:MAG: hypothetical protein L3J37_08595 [Rhodobacteraceae bacterium]|nr:hypothetical protein [Paracoccaceae bacterium]
MQELQVGVDIVDTALIDRLKLAYGFSFPVSPLPHPFEKPSLIVTGRQDNIVGYQDALSLLPSYPRASFAVLDRAGHNLQIEQDGVVKTLFGAWLDRVEETMGQDLGNLRRIP